MVVIFGVVEELVPHELKVVDIKIAVTASCSENIFFDLLFKSDYFPIGCVFSSYDILYLVSVSQMVSGCQSQSRADWVHIRNHVYISTCSQGREPHGISG